jgi:hypothetical protein
MYVQYEVIEMQWTAVVELNVFIAQLSELNWLQYNCMEDFLLITLSRIFTTNPLPD